VRPILLPRRKVLRRDEESLRLGAHLRSLRQVLPAPHLPPPVVPLRAQIVETGLEQRLFVEVRNLSGHELEELGIEAVTYDAQGREQDVMFAALGDLFVASDPRRVVPVAAGALDHRVRAASASVSLVYARFAGGGFWDGKLTVIEDARASDYERMRAQARFFRPYRDFMRIVEGVGCLERSS
jgi:hypothetical protein